MTQDFYDNHPDWIIEHSGGVSDPLKDVYTHKWDEDDLLISFDFVLKHHYLFGGVDISEFNAGEIFWDDGNDSITAKLVYQYLRDLEGVIPEMYDEKMIKLPRNKMPREYWQYDDSSPIQITPENAKQYIGRDIEFKTRGQKMSKTILDVSETGKSIRIDHPDLNNTLQIVTRKVYLCN
jgi:hypothetical protein